MIRLANAAAGTVVSKFSSPVASSGGLDEALEAEPHQSDPQKFVSVGLEAAVRRREERRKHGLKVGF